MRHLSLVPLDARVFTQQILEAQLPSLLLFGGPACVPCHTLEPQLAELALAYQGQAQFYGVDTEAEVELAANYQVRGLPTVLIFSRGN